MLISALFWNYYPSLKSLQPQCHQLEDHLCPGEPIAESEVSILGRAHQTNPVQRSIWKIYAREKLIKLCYDDADAKNGKSTLCGYNFAHLCTAPTTFLMNFLSSLSTPGPKTKVPFVSDPSDGPRTGPPGWDSP